ncbi:polysaccharide deacetylase family protein [Bordetella genomosp. 10]|uniref:polysaccharide deacetylase family protein n=1 Tax=Bordetella genomosp. 10 TaxID=1416804 RepID=UPI001C529F5C|nr:polysaccharide deacetylase family protein [Bordetella genomosp. 10]
MSELLIERDLHGYGNAPPAVRFPHGAALAVSLVVNFEEGAEWSVADGDAAGERMAEIHSVIPAGQWDQGTEQQFAYGMRAGVWRVLRALEKHRRHVTFYMCGRAVERSPHIARAIVAAGHEAACHGWRWQPHAGYASREAERADLLRCLDAMERATGQRPRGFFCRGSESRWTRGLLRELGFAYTSNGLDDDLPYWDRDAAGHGGEPLLVIPYAFDTNDMKFFHPNGFVRAGDMVDYVRDAIEVLLEEGRAGAPKLLNIGMHLRIVGRPGRFLALQRILEILDGYGDRIWMPRRIDLAGFWRERFPSHP